MNVQQLPEEILIIILRKLDLKSLLCIYNTCIYLRRIVTLRGVIRVWKLSLTTLATAESLKLCFFKDISAHMETVDLCAVPDLTKSSLLPAMKTLKNLKTLNVAYTNIIIPDLMDFYKLCPTLKNITINFTFGKVNASKLPPKLIAQCQEMFKHFDKIEFVGSINNLLYSHLPLHVLQKANLKTAKFTVIQCNHTTYQSEECSSVFTFEQFYIFLSHWKEGNIYYGNLGDIKLLSTIDLSQFEFVIIKRINFHLCKIYTSALFKGVFMKNFHIEEECITEYSQQQLSGNVNIILWNKEKTCFDETFFLKFINKMKEFFPCHYNSSCTEDGFPLMESSWYHISIAPTATAAPSKENSSQQEPAFKKRRIAPQSQVLSFDSICEHKKEIQLNFNFNVILKNPVSLSPNSQYLKKITYLSLSGPFVQYSMDFFRILFQSCDKLHTLNVEACPVSPCVLSISRFILCTKTLRNFRLVDKRIDFKFLFCSLSQYGLLENIHIVDKASEPNELGNVSQLVSKCDSMYSLFIQASMSNSARMKALRAINKAKQHHRKPYLNVELYSGCGYMGLSYDPFIDVFKLSPIKHF